MNYSPRLRLLLLAVVIVAGFCALFYRLWYLQIDQQEFYIAQQPETDTAKQRVPGTRGNLRDRTGNYYFARNETSMEIGINLRAVELAWNEKHRADLRKGDFKKPVRTYPNNVEGLDIIAVLNEMVFQPLNDLKLYKVPASEAAKRKQEQSIIISYMSNKGVIPFPYEKDLLQGDEENFRRFTAYAENATAIPGLTITERPKRRYPMKAMAGHIIGYIQENRDVLPPDEKAAMEKAIAEAQAAGKSRPQFYFEADDFGVAGLEESQNEKLRGKPGERIWHVNEHHRLTDEIQELRRDPLPGADVFLTIDARKQYIAEMALRDSGAGRAAAVIMDPNTGEVLGIASIPSYDPSMFLPPKDNDAINALYDKESPFPPASLPLALRADVPGSAFKLMTALAAAISGRPVIHNYSCNGEVQIGRHAPKCMGHHGSLGMADAIKQSCNCYFMRLSMATKIESMQKVTRLFRFGQQDMTMGSGIEVPGMEGNGRLATSDGHFTEHETALVGMGQGPVSVTPLQLAMLASAIGNGGKIYQPTLIHHYEEQQYDRDGRRQKVITEFKPKLLADLIKLGVKQRDLETMQQGMWKVVNEKGGTAIARAKSTMVVIAGKTSTAQRPVKGKDEDRVWFMAYAPADKPTIAVAVMVINGKSGGRVAAPIAKRIIEQCVGVDAGTYHVKPYALEPAKGGYNRLEEVVFEGDSIPVEPDEPETAEGTGEEPDAEPVAVAPEPKETAPKAEVIPEDDAPVLARQTLEPVKFRLKTDPPNPPAPPPAAKAN